MQNAFKEPTNKKGSKPKRKAKRMELKHSSEREGKAISIEEAERKTCGKDEDGKGITESEARAQVFFKADFYKYGAERTNRRGRKGGVRK